MICMNKDEYIRKISEAKEYIFSITGIDNFNDYIAIVLGSGLGDLTESISNKINISYKDIPNMPQSTVIGHKNQLVVGSIYGKKVILMSGRFHYYEGYSNEEIAFGIRLFKMLGITKLILTNAAGAVNKAYKTGDIMLISDHINFGNVNPLIGPNLEEFGERFPSISDAYSKEIREKIYNECKAQDLNVHEGVYAFMKGPSYETKAETDMLRILGADSVGMSTVPEVIVAMHAGMKVIGFSCLTNSCNDEYTSHSIVVDAAKEAGDNLKKVLEISLNNM